MLNFWSLFGWIIIGAILGVALIKRRTERSFTHAREMIRETGPDSPEKRLALVKLAGERHAGYIIFGSLGAVAGVATWAAGTLLVWLTGFLPPG